MTPHVRSGALVTVEPVEMVAIRRGDIVLCRVRGADYLHFVKARESNRCLIGNAHGHINGWTSQIFGRLTRVEP